MSAFFKKRKAIEIKCTIGGMGVYPLIIENIYFPMRNSGGGKRLVVRCSSLIYIYVQEDFKKIFFCEKMGQGDTCLILFKEIEFIIS